jgi:hypothetical protein
MLQLSIAFGRRQAVLLAACILSCAWAARLPAAEVRLIYPEMEPSLDGKEVDWIYGDYLMENDQISLVIGAPIKTRDANLTVRGIGAAIIDLSLKQPSNDQLSAYFPGGARYLFHDPSQVEVGRDAAGVFWKCRSSQTLTEDGTIATVTYRLADGDAFVQATVEISGTRPEDFEAFDGIRADRTFRFDTAGTFAYCADDFFRQAVGFRIPGSTESPRWDIDRLSRIRYRSEHLRSDDEQLRWTVHLYPATSVLDLQGALAGGTMRTLEVVKSGAPEVDGADVTRAEIELSLVDDPNVSGTIRTDDQGVANVRLPSGELTWQVSAIGFPDFRGETSLGEAQDKLQLTLANGSGLHAKIADQEGMPIPAKATIYRLDGEQPSYGPDSTRTFVRNCVYAVHGELLAPLEPGKYEVYFSHGPEYNAEARQFEIAAGGFVQAEITLPRVVDTRGWVSTELHSHSSPSGDNVSDQFGRVENLLCEHLEFAPCTEHARVSSYVPHLEAMGLVELMATCSGIELTGSPLPVNHQNAFPLHHHPHTQNGGGPRTDVNPEVQIERLAMWDKGSDKVVQQNHPNLHQIFGDVDVDGNPDSGFKGMFQWMDVVEVHPLQVIFQDVAANPPAIDEMRIPIFQWMQMLNQGIRVPGVVNTDAHYNHHGSGWLRNWFASATDDPAEIDIEEMIHAAEHGHIIMSTGPFLQVRATTSAQDRPAIVGEDIRVGSDQKVRLDVRVQCPNWLDVNRVQVFVNGRPQAELNRTRRTHSSQFGAANEVVKFEGTFEIELETDAHLIVATIGEGLTMQKVMGEQYGNIPPIAVSNPIFVDVDGDGFQPNGDELGVPLPRREGTATN